MVLSPSPELVSSELTTSDAPEDTVELGMSELAPTPGLVAVEGVLYNSLWEKGGAVEGKGVLVRAEWTQVAVVSVSPGVTVEVGRMELSSVPGCVLHEAVVCGPCGESVGFGKVVLAVAPELVIRDVTIPDTPGDTLVFAMSELASALGLVDVEAVLSSSLTE